MAPPSPFKGTRISGRYPNQVPPSPALKSPRMRLMFYARFMIIPSLEAIAHPLNASVEIIDCVV